MDRQQDETIAGLPLLATKLHAPGWRPGFVSRPRLTETLNERAGRKLTLVAAPAGFGKTTLLAEWLAAAPVRARCVAWVSLDSGDNDPARFWTYVAAALRATPPGLGGSALALLRAPHPPPIESVLTVLINELAGLEDDVALVLDDLHVIEARPVHQALAFLLDHLPPRLHLVIATRADPLLPLARLRGRGELAELRAADLRFTLEEAGAFFNGMMKLDLTASDVTALEERTEGWIAGLQLAALSMRGNQDIPGFIRTFAGDHRYVVDYLVEEVLRRQPEAVRSFLLQSAILDRLNGALCDAVTGQDDCAARLEELERGNFFLVPLDDQRRWWRYHHLFAGVLKARLMAEHPGLAATLHQRASAWHERHGAAPEAIEHARAAGDTARAADLIERAVPELHRNRMGVTLLGWLKALPDAEIRRRPVLSVAYAWALMAGGELDAVEGRLRDAERWLDAPSAEMVVVDKGELRRLPGGIAMYRAARSMALGDVDATVTHAQRALEILPADEHSPRGAAAALLGLASWTNGDLDLAHRHYADGMESLDRAGHDSDVITGAVTLADIEMAQGRLRDAERTLDRAVRRAGERGERNPRETPDLFVGLSELRRERNDLPAAIQFLLKSEEVAKGSGLPYNRSRWCAAMARIKEAEGDMDGAFDLLDEAERRYAREFSPNVRPLGALKARLRLAQGRVGEGLDWVEARGLSVDDDVSYLREFEQVTLARVLLAQSCADRADHSPDHAVELLKRLLDLAETGGRVGTVIEILMLQALAHAARGNVTGAIAPLERALVLAEPEGFVRIFVDEGEEMRALLRKAAAKGITSSYRQRLLGAFSEPASSSSPQSKAPPATLAEPLTPREIEILRLIAAGLRNQEIADRLFISLPTVKRHVANAYGKLGAGHRTEAIARANELNLL